VRGRASPALRRVVWFLIAAAAAAGAITAYLLLRVPTFPVRVDGRTVIVEEGTTLGTMIRAERLHARNGRLLDVEGELLQRRADRGAILLNGDQRPRSALLVEGDRVNVVHGHDATEETIRVTEKLDQPQSPNPARVLGKSPGVQVTFQGEISGKVVESYFEPTGKPDRPQAVALTFDDGPWPGTTSKILHILQRYQAPATFFVVGSAAESSPGLLRRLRHAGVAVGNHTWTHPTDPDFADLGADRALEEMQRTSELLQVSGKEVTLFRPPGGSWDDDVRESARRLGMRLVLWDVDPRDWQRSRKPKQITKFVLSHVRPGSIVLLHDGGGDAKQTIAALPDIIQGLRKQGYRLVAV